MPLTLYELAGISNINMADLPFVERIEFIRPYNNDVNLYVTNISRQLDKETVQVSPTRFLSCLLKQFVAVVRQTLLFNQSPCLKSHDFEQILL